MNNRSGLMAMAAMALTATLPPGATHAAMAGRAPRLKRPRRVSEKFRVGAWAGDGVRPATISRQRRRANQRAERKAMGY